MWELFEEDEQLLRDFMNFLHKSKLLAADIQSDEYKNTLIKLFVKDENDTWKREMKAKKKESVSEAVNAN